jgi:hypothetical protein
MNGEFLIEQGSGSANEDRILVAEGIAAVFDGATSIHAYVDESGNTGGALAASIAKQTFAKNNKPLVDLATEANQRIRLAMQQQRIDIADKLNLWATTVAAIRILGNEIEWLTLSDSIVMVFDANGGHRLLGKFHDHDIEGIKVWKKFTQRKIENISEEREIKDVLAQNRRQANRTYGALNGDPAFVDFVESGTCLRDNITHVLLATDGLFLPTQNRDDKCWDQFAAIYLKGGLKAIRDFVRQREKSDPNCWNYPRFKCHDDIAAVAITF